MRTPPPDAGREVAQLRGQLEASRTAARTAARAAERGAAQLRGRLEQALSSARASEQDASRLRAELAASRAREDAARDAAGDALDSAAAMGRQLSAERAATARRVFECPIGLHDVLPDDALALPCCGYRLCRACLVAWVSDKVDSMHVAPTCPDPECRRPLAFAFVSGLDAQLGSRAFQVMAARVMRQHACARHPACAGRIHLSDPAVHGYRACPICLLPQCATCHAPAAEHARGCGAIIDAAVDARLAQLARDASDVSRACPSCLRFIVKDAGCNSITCPACRACFCWLCGTVTATPEDAEALGADDAYALGGLHFSREYDGADIVRRYGQRFHDARARSANPACVGRHFERPDTTGEYRVPTRAQVRAAMFG